MAEIVTYCLVCLVIGFLACGDCDILLIFKDLETR
uniref:Uncharacterized protein n=1 Tax=Anguilla anguilla TaxID=7936 RepID=A0A0E9XZY4_ANGAN